MKKLKYFLLVFVLLLVVAGGYVLYELKFKEYDVADEKVDEILKEEYTIELPDGTVLTIDADGQIVEGKTEPTATTTDGNADAEPSEQDGQAEEADGQDEQGQSDSVGTTSANGGETVSTTDGKLTVAQIKDKYRPAFAALEGQAKSRLSGLIGQAKSEYSSKKANGESISYGYFYNKYMGAATSMEASTDAAVKSLLSIVRKELEANGYSSSYADSFSQEYEASKAALRSSLLAEVKSAF